MDDSSACPDLDAAPIRTLLAHLGAAMVATGQPVGEVEDELAEASAALGHPDAQVAAAPTGVTLALDVGSPATFAAVIGPLRLDQAAEVREIRHDLVRHRLDPAAAQARLLTLRSQPPRYPSWLADLGWIAVAVGIALILQPGLAGVAVAAVGTVVVVALVHVVHRLPSLAALLPVGAAFAVACLVFAATRAGLVESPLRTLLPPLAILLPGALIVTAMAELAAGDMVAGTARLVYGLAQVLLFTLGILLARGLFALPVEELRNVRVDELGWVAAPLGLVLITIGIGLIESPPPRLLTWIGLVLVLTFAAAAVGQQVSGATLGAFLGALTATVGSHLVEAVAPRLPRLVVFLPSFWLLVPGSLGVLAAAQVAVDPSQAASTTLGVLGVVTGMALGLLLGAALAGAGGDLLRRTRDRRTRPASGVSDS